jgi:F-type H+-transporting ATPase subunit delta
MAGRYATALFELAVEANAIDSVAADLGRLDDLIAGNADLNRLVRSPAFSSEDQLRALSALLERIGIDGLSARFLKVVTSNRRLFAVRDMIRSYRALVALHKGEVSARVTVAEMPIDKRIADIKNALTAVTGKDVTLDISVEPSIIGGLIVQLGSRMVDASLRTKLNAIKHAMKEVG